MESMAQTGRVMNVALSWFVLDIELAAAVQEAAAVDGA
jgi:hypothetical protein